jgi:hypothetical protein
VDKPLYSREKREGRKRLTGLKIAFFAADYNEIYRNAASG